MGTSRLVGSSPFSTALETDHAIGTGKTTVVIEILVAMLRERVREGDEEEDDEPSRMLVTASTHNGRLYVLVAPTTG
jgi:hypothetical protein